MFETASQPRSIAAAPDGTVFIAEVDGIEAIRSNQRVFELKPKFTPSAVAVSGTTVAVGGEVCHQFFRLASCFENRHLPLVCNRIRKSVCMTGTAKRSRRLASLRTTRAS